MAALYTLTLAFSAALLFAVQPMVARMALPTLGGAPAVWNTCMVFFQAMVLGGYLLAHLLARCRCSPLQVGAFLVLVVLGAMGLPAVLETGHVKPPSAPLAWLLNQLNAEVALPALALATASPLLQRWFARAHVDQREPFFLYAASNAGSLGALLAYPAVIEPRLGLQAQAGAWTLGYGLWGLLALLGAATALHRERASKRHLVPLNAAPSIPLESKRSPTPWLTWAHWAALGAVPASLLQGCTLFLTTDLASVPLLWVIPLALYLLTFVLAFSRAGQVAVRAANRTLPFLAVALLFVVLSRATQPVALLLSLHLLFLFSAGLVCHGRLVALRPAAHHLTAFYLALAAGGVVGGAFNVLLAPRLFTNVTEYPIAMALACAFLPRRTRPQAVVRPGIAWARDFASATAVATGLIVLGLVVPWFTTGSERWRDALVFGLPAIVCGATLDRPRRLALVLLASFLAGLWLQGHWTHTQYAERNFFGITRVTLDAEGRFHQLVHGNTIHGRQFRDPAGRREPLAYYHREGPLGSIFAALPSRTPATLASTNAPRDSDGTRQIGVVGLGVGSMAAYARAEESWTFYEIDPAVIRVARDPRWFTFLADSPAGRMRLVEGDARLRLAEEPDATFDLLVLDAFSSDAIPVHLLTREALALYLRKLRPGGWLSAHISNRYLDLEPLFAALARDAGLTCWSANDMAEGDAAGKDPSHWIIVARHAADFGDLARRRIWVPAEGADRVPAWTDQRAALLPLFEWN